MLRRFKLQRFSRYVTLHILIALGLIVIPLSSVATGGQGQEENVLGLQQLIDLAVSKSPEMGEIRMEMEAAKSDLAQVKAAYYPQVDVTAITGPTSDAEEPVIRNNRIHNPPDGPGDSDIGIFGRLDFTITQPIYTFGKLSNRKEAASLGMKVKELDLRKQKYEIALRIKQLYYALILARQGIDASNDAGGFFDDARRRITRLLKLDSPNVVESDLYKIDAYRAGCIRSRAEAEKGAKVAYFALKYLIGLPPGKEFQVPEKTLSLNHKKFDDLKGYIQKAFHNRPEYKQIEKALEAQEYQVKAAQSDRYPSFFLAMEGSFAGAPGRDKFDHDYISDEFNHVYAGVIAGLTWNFDFGIGKARIEKERAIYKRLIQTKASAEMNIPIQIAKIYQEIQEWEKAVESYHKAAVASRKWVITALTDFDMGVGSATEMLNAIEKYGENESHYLEGLFNYNLSLAKLECAVGIKDWQ